MFGSTDLTVNCAPSGLLILSVDTRGNDRIQDGQIREKGGRHEVQLRLQHASHSG